jgi:hypothetical protein
MIMAMDQDMDTTSGGRDARFLPGPSNLPSPPDEHDEDNMGAFESDAFAPIWKGQMAQDEEEQHQHIHQPQPLSYNDAGSSSRGSSAGNAWGAFQPREGENRVARWGSGSPSSGSNGAGGGAFTMTTLDGGNGWGANVKTSGFNHNHSQRNSHQNVVVDTEDADMEEMEEDNDDDDDDGEVSRTERMGLPTPPEDRPLGMTDGNKRDSAGTWDGRLRSSNGITIGSEGGGGNGWR